MGTRYNHLELALVHIEALYVHDGGGRLVRINEPDPEHPAPRFYMFRTTSGNLWRTRYDLPDQLAAKLAYLASSEPVAPDQDALRQPPRHTAEYTRLLQEHAQITGTYAGPTFYLPELQPPEDAVTITPENLTLLETHFPYTLSTYTELAPVVVRVVDGEAVAVCYSARITARCAEAGVHTVEAYRGRGYAVQVVRGWAAAISASGRLPLYSTWWENSASQAVAARLGAVPYGADFSIT
jgi:RimJ/RimL family protein N-acetyltransferase